MEKSLSGYCKNFRAAHRESNAHAHFVPEITYNVLDDGEVAIVRTQNAYTFSFLGGNILKEGGLKFL